MKLIRPVIKIIVKQIGLLRILRIRRRLGIQGSITYQKTPQVQLQNAFCVNENNIKLHVRGVNCVKMDFVNHQKFIFRLTKKYRIDL